MLAKWEHCPICPMIAMACSQLLPSETNHSDYHEWLKTTVCVLPVLLTRLSARSSSADSRCFRCRSGNRLKWSLIPTWRTWRPLWLLRVYTPNTRNERSLTCEKREQYTFANVTDNLQLKDKLVPKSS